VPKFVASRCLIVLSPFRSNCRGNVGIIFALATLPLFAFIGAAIDYSQAAWAKAIPYSNYNSDMCSDFNVGDQRRANAAHLPRLAQAADSMLAAALL
jgi:Putative Flp pilus-assembly TadE/G-like